MRSKYNPFFKMNPESFPCTKQMQHARLVSRCEKDTRLIGRLIGNLADFSLIIGLNGDLGSGKTCLVQGLALGLEVPEDQYVTSPSFTLINEYQGKLSLFHVDLYRIDNPVDFEEIGLFDALYGDGVIAVEWVDRLHGSELEEFLMISINIGQGESRILSIDACGTQPARLLNQLIKAYEDLSINPE